MIDIQLILHSLPALLQGLSISLYIALCSLSIGFIGGTFLGILQTGKNPFVRACVTCIVTIIRGTPMLVQIFFLYYVLTSYFSLSALATAIFAIGCNSSAYVSQIIRSGIQALPRGQLEAAKTLGISRRDMLRFIILPQALRTVLPALGNEGVTLIKDSSLASLIGVVELYKQGQIIISTTYDAISIYCIIALLYLIVTTSLSLVIAYLEKKCNAHAQNNSSF